MKEEQGQVSKVNVLCFRYLRLAHNSCEVPARDFKHSRVFLDASTHLLLLRLRNYPLAVWHVVNMFKSWTRMVP